MLKERPLFILFTDNMIYYYIEQSGLYHYVNDETVCVHPSRIRPELIKKTADKILQLVEGGDLVDVLFTGNQTYYKLEVLEIDENHLKTSHLTLSGFEFTGSAYSRDESHRMIPFCRGFYKLKKNGDYVHYTIIEED